MKLFSSDKGMAGYHKLWFTPAFLILLSLSLSGLSYSQNRSALNKGLTLEDLTRILRLEVLKLKFAAPADKSGQLKYWIESIQPDGTRVKQDECSVGLGNGDSEFLIRLPNTQDLQFGILTAVNETWGKSKLQGDSESLGAERWDYLSNQKVTTGRTILAIRAFGSDYTGEDENLDNSLKQILNGKFVRVDVFVIEITNYP